MANSVILGVVFLFFQNWSDQTYPTHPSACALLERKIQKLESRERVYPYVTDEVENDKILELLNSWLRSGQCETYQALYYNGLDLEVLNPAEPIVIYSNYDNILAPIELANREREVEAYCYEKKREGLAEKKIETFLYKLSRVPGLSNNVEVNLAQLEFYVEGQSCTPYIRSPW